MIVWLHGGAKAREMLARRLRCVPASLAHVPPDQEPACPPCILLSQPPTWPIPHRPAALRLQPLPTGPARGTRSRPRAVSDPACGLVRAQLTQRRRSHGSLGTVRRPRLPLRRRNPASMDIGTATLADRTWASGFVWTRSGSRAGPASRRGNGRSPLAACASPIWSAVGGPTSLSAPPGIAL